MKSSFVYRWKDTVTGMMYIGVHKGTPDDGYICSSKVMLPIYLERPDTFIREILSQHDSYTEARIEEQRLLSMFDAAHDPTYYNKHNGGGEKFALGGPMSEETKRKIGKANKGRRHTSETISKMRLKAEGRAFFKGKRHTEETKRKISLSKTGKLLPLRSDSHSKKISEAKKGKKFTEEHRRKLSESHKKRLQKEDHGQIRACDS